MLDAASVDAMHPLRGRPEFARLRARPRAVVEPADVAEVAALVRWAAATRTALVARGGGSGLMGGAAVIRPSVVVDLRRLASLRVDPDACLVHAGAGATLARVDAALAPHGLMLGHHPWTVRGASRGPAGRRPWAAWSRRTASAIWAGAPATSGCSSAASRSCWPMAASSGRRPCRRAPPVST